MDKFIEEDDSMLDWVNRIKEIYDTTISEETVKSYVGHIVDCSAELVDNDMKRPYGYSARIVGYEKSVVGLTEPVVYYSLTTDEGMSHKILKGSKFTTIDVIDDIETINDLGAYKGAYNNGAKLLSDEEVKELNSKVNLNDIIKDCTVKYAERFDGETYYHEAKGIVKIVPESFPSKDNRIIISCLDETMGVRGWSPYVTEILEVIKNGCRV